MCNHDKNKAKHPATHMIIQACKLLIVLYTCAYMHNHRGNLGKGIGGKTSICVDNPAAQLTEKDKRCLSCCVGTQIIKVYIFRKTMLFLFFFSPHMFRDQIIWVRQWITSIYGKVSCVHLRSSGLCACVCVCVCVHLQMIMWHISYMPHASNYPPSFHPYVVVVSVEW